MPAAKWSVHRLHERLGEARIESPWHPRAGRPEEIVRFGPLTCDVPDPHLICKQESGRLQMTLTGLGLSCETVGSIRIEMERPRSAFFDVLWGKGAGRIRVPIEGSPESGTFAIRTTGLPEWSGPLDELHIRAETPEGGARLVSQVAFLGPEDSFRQAAGAARVSLGRQTRDALYVHVPAAVRFEGLAVPQTGRFKAGLGVTLPHGRVPDRTAEGLASPARTPAPVAFSVLVEHAGQTTSVLERKLEPSEAWHDVTVSLEPWQGKRVDVVLRAASPAPDAIAHWASPIVYQPVAAPPGFAIYLIDALSARHVSLYGYSRPTVPNLETLSKRGVWFENMFANAPRTIESVPNLLLSRYTRQHGVTNLLQVPPDGLVSLAQQMKDAGYATASFSTNVNAGPRQKMDRGFELFSDHVAFWWSDDADRTVPIDAVMAWLRANQDRPVFVYIHTAEPHDPYTPPSSHAGRFSSPGRPGSRRAAGHRDRFAAFRDPWQIARVVALYDEEVAYADSRLAALMQAVAGLHRDASFCWFVTADHGEEFREHGYWLHGRSLYDPAIRVPLVVFGAAVGSRGPDPTPVQTADIMPTILDLAGVVPPYPLSGTSLRPLLQGGTSWIGRVLSPLGGRASTGLEDRAIVSSSYWHGDAVEYSLTQEGGWKLMLRRSREQATDGGATLQFALYDLANDPGEQRDLIDVRRQVASRLIHALLRWHRRIAPPPEIGPEGGRPEAVEMDGEQLQQLRALGYVQ